MFTVFGLRYDCADALLMVGVIPSEHAAAAVELDGDDPTSPVGRHRPR
ncbi:MULTISPECIES: hypothetical protein [unclassified Streptomyces]